MLFVDLFRALEQKKEAFAKAEVERRKEALELRRKGQKEATMRFKSVFKKPPISTKSQISRKAQDTKGEYILYNTKFWREKILANYQ